MIDRPLYSLLGPVVLDGDGNGVTLVGVAASKVMFDMDGDGIKDRTGWVGPNDAILVYDANRNGIVDNGREIGFQPYLSGAISDLDGLRAFDTNGNGLLDAGDASYSQFALWIDANQNGLTDTDELTTLDDAEVQSIGLTGKRTGATPDGKDNTLFATGGFTLTDGTKGTLGDVFLAFEPGKDTGGGTGSGGTNTGGSTPVNDPPTLAMATQGFDRKAKKYVMEAKDGSLYVHLKKSVNLVDPRAGQVGAATIMTFKRSTVGILSPIVLDLNGNGLDLVRRKKSHTAFDMNGDGVGDRTGWIGRSEGMLVLDRNGDGKITAASELSFLTEKPDAKNEFDALAALDSNKDGKLDKTDKRFGELKVWRDTNQNGVTDTGELVSLGDLGIVEIGLASRANNATAKIGESLVLSTSYFKRSNGTTSTVGEVALAFDPSAPRVSPSALSDISSLKNAESQLREMRALLAEPTTTSDDISALSGSSTMETVDPIIARMTQAMASFGADDQASLALRNESGQPAYQLHA